MEKKNSGRMQRKTCEERHWETMSSDFQGAGNSREEEETVKEYGIFMPGIFVKANGADASSPA